MTSRPDLQSLMLCARRRDEPGAGLSRFGHGLVAGKPRAELRPGREASELAHYDGTFDASPPSTPRPSGTPYERRAACNSCREEMTRQRAFSAIGHAPCSIDPLSANQRAWQEVGAMIRGRAAGTGGGGAGAGRG